MKNELKEEMLKAIFVQTGGRPENPKIADVCATVAVNFITSNGMLKVTSDSTENKKESEVALPSCEYCKMEGDKHNEDCPDHYGDE